MASQYEASRAAERRYASRLKKLARTIAKIIKEHIDGNTLRDVDEMMRKLQQYAEQLDEWAKKTAALFIGDTSRTNEKAWVAHSKKLRKQLRSAMAKGTIGLTARQLQDQQVTLIKSLPIEAGRRAQQLAQEAMMDSTRAADLSKRLLETERITKNRATLIARTEIAKANAAMTRSRAQFVGVTHYIWRTAQDGDVRPSHQAMEGQVCEFASPPMVEGEGFHHPGEIYNCRCYAEPVLTDDEDAQ